MKNIFLDSDSAGGLDLSKYQNTATFWSKLRRFLWAIVQGSLFRWSPQRAFWFRRSLLQLFGAKLSPTSYIYPSTKIRDPAFLEVGEHSSIGPEVHVYSVDRIVIGSHCTVSTQAFLCTGSHDISDPQMKLLHAPIYIDNGAWICARAFISPGIRFAEGAVVAACSVVTKDVEAWTVVAGNPAVFRKQRKVESAT
jgi:putative colanic acid biosynthesis acetyltransferase WcaF